MRKKVFFTWEHTQGKHRTRLLRGLLWSKGYRLQRSPPAEFDKGIWAIVLHYDNSYLLRNSTIELILKFQGILILIDVSDHPGSSLAAIPRAVQSKCRLYLKNHYLSRETSGAQKGTICLSMAPTFIRPFPAKKGKAQQAREHDVFFIGANTGIEHPEFRLQRQKAVGILRSQKKYSFPGGLITSVQYPVPAEMQIEPMDRTTFINSLDSTKICLALWGNCPLTYRFFEGLARRCVVFAPDFSEYNWVKSELMPQTHYISIRPDLSDLLEKIAWVKHHPDRAQKIADNGFNLYRSTFSVKGCRMQKPMEQLIWQGFTASGLFPDDKSDCLKRLSLSLLKSI